MTYQIDKKRSIGQAAKEIGVQEHVIRFWETQFDSIQPTIGSGKRRYFYDKDIKMLQIIKYYLYEKGLTIKGLQKILKDGEINIDNTRFMNVNDTNYTNGLNNSGNFLNNGINKKNINASILDENNDYNVKNVNTNFGKSNFFNENNFDESSKKNNLKLKENLKTFKNKLNIFYEKLKSI